MPSAWAATVGREASNVCIAAWVLLFCPRARAPGARRACPFRRARSEAGTRQSSKNTSAVCEARRPCFETFVPSLIPLASLFGTTKAAWPLRAQLAVDRGDHHVMSAMPPLVAHAFWPLITHSLAASSNLAVVRTPEMSEPALGSEAQKAATLTSSEVPKQRGIHSPICSGVPWPKMAATAQRGAHDRHADAGVAPEQLLVDDRQRQAARVGEELRHPFEPVQPDLGGLFDDRPRRLLALVLLMAAGPHHVGGEAVDPVADVLLSW